MLAFKGHCGLPLFSAWTEKDILLSSYLDAAELIVDRLGGSPYRQRNFKLTLENLDHFRTNRMGWWGLELPMHPVLSGASLSWADDDGNTGTYVQGTDFTIFAPTSLRPQLRFPYNWQKPCTSQQPYPYVLTFMAGAGDESLPAKIAIFELGAYYYRNPEAMSDGSLPQSAVFDANISILKGSFL